MDTNIIARRRHEVEQEIARLKSRIASLTEEMSELDVAERVLARLSGAERSEPRARHEPQSTGASGVAKTGGLTMPEMIETVLREEEAAASRFEGMTPKEIATAIGHRYPGAEVRGEAVSSICWRMRKRGQLVKDENTPTYRLSEKEKPADESRPDSSPAGLFSNVLRREPEQGGGT